MIYSLKPSGPFNQPVLVDSTGKEYGWDKTLPGGHPASAEYMRLFRASTGLSQHKFSVLLGTTPSSINRWEHGSRCPQYAVYLACCGIWQETKRKEIEALKEEAGDLVRDPENIDLVKLADVQKRLEEYLPDTDPFWIRWRFIGEQQGWIK